jgi:hypothetical protein
MQTWPKHSLRYGVEDSYKVGMGWLKDCEVVEDWGCGPAYSKNYRVGKYIGVDGTEGFCDKQAALESYTSEVEGIFMRHVLEHNLSWKPILENALRSFTKRMSLIFFTPWAEKTFVVHEWKGIPFISFKKEEILELINPYLIKEVAVPYPKKGMTDTVFCLQKQNYGANGNRASINPTE